MLLKGSLEGRWSTLLFVGTMTGITGQLSLLREIWQMILPSPGREEYLKQSYEQGEREFLTKERTDPGHNKAGTPL